MSQITESDLIKDVQIVTLTAFADSRGRFMEMFRKEWFPQRSWDIIQTNRSESEVDVLRGLHYHFHQVDYWHVISGTIRVALFDLRPHSPTHGVAHTLELRGELPMGLFIPIGVAHGFVALSPVTLTYTVDNYYDSSDEYGVLWNDPDIGMPWGVTNPIISERDMENPRWKDITPTDLPQ